MLVFWILAPVSGPDFIGMAMKSLMRDKLRQSDIFYFFKALRMALGLADYSHRGQGQL